MARRFRFRLQTLLKVRQLREREAQRKVAGKRAAIARLDQLDEQTGVEISRQQAALLGGQECAQLDALELQRGRAWIAYLRKTIGLRQPQRVELQQQLQQLQDQLRTARTQTRIIEKLYQRRWDEYADNRKRREQADADELARQLHGFVPM